MSAPLPSAHEPPPRGAASDLAALVSSAVEVSFDLEDGYYALALHEDDRDYFTVEVDGELFQFVGLPMGWRVGEAKELYDS